MSIEILPGFSPHNEEWAINIQRELKNLGPVTVVRWPHWDSKTTEKNWIEKEANKIINRIGNSKITIIAKSIGTLVAMEILKNKSVNVDKLILCGVPIEDFQEDDEDRFKILRNIDANKIIVFQNEKDPHGKPDQVRGLINQANPNIKIEPKPRSDHEYPYSTDFIAFISGTIN
jgi:predicted alpha/beta hydrolase family esterase